MNDFWKRPSFIAAVIIAACYFLLPYYQVKSERGKDKGTISFTGMAFLTEKASFKGDLYEDLKDKQKKKATEALFEEPDRDNTKSLFGLVDKLNVLLLIGSGLLLFGAYKTANGEESPLDDNKIKWTKIIMLILAGFLWTRYQFSITQSTEEGAGFGMHLTLLACVFIMFEDFIMAKVNEKVLNKS